MEKKQKFIYLILVICFTIITLFLTFKKHNKYPKFDFHSEIWADRSGYYVYLPAAINFKFNPHNFPDSIVCKTGYGFKLDLKHNKIYTKYTCGVALLQLPFYLIAELLAKISDLKPSGFTIYHHWCIDIASVFYLILGLYFLGAYLKTHFKSPIVYITLFSIFFATNLYYYSIFETGMSHVYSFSLFSIYLYFLHRSNFLLRNNFYKNVLFGIVCGLIILIRPLNAIFLLIYFFLNIENITDIIIRIKKIIHYKTFLPIFIGTLIIISNQLIYWMYTYGSLVYYSYGKEGFNWINPKPILTWFSPNNGLFLYTPFYFVLIISMIIMVRKKIINGVFILILFIVLTYMLSCWWDYSFGCSFGARSYVEYLAILSIPFAHLIKRINQKKKVLLTGGFCLLILLMIVFNLKMTYSFDGCSYAINDWDWNAYKVIITHSLK